MKHDTSDTPPPDALERQDDCPLCDDRCLNYGEIQALRQRNVELTELALTDELTGLFNYRFMRQALPKEMERTDRTGLPTALAILDLDRFKRLNDTYGHDNGNRVLVQTAHLILGAIRKIDLACRFGGEEIVLIMPNTYIEQAVMVAERIRVLLATTPVDTPLGRIHYTGSLGVDVYLRGEPLTPDGLLARADKALYEAKRSGRNKVVARTQGDDTFVTAEERDQLLKR